jgi:hypothetical protein
MSYYRSRPLDPLTKALGPAEAFVLGLAGGATLVLWDWLTWEGGGEAVDVWTRIAFRFGLLGIGLSAGATVAEVLEKLVG